MFELKPLIIALFALLIPHNIMASPERIAPHSQFLLGGIQVNEPDQARWVSGLKTSGMNTVSVTVYAWQGVWDSADINYSEDDFEAKLEEIRAAKSEGLNVVLIMRVALQHAHPENRFLWHGMIMPKTDRELEMWFERYSGFVERWAQVAEREGVDIFVIGSEMNALTSTTQISSLPEYISYFEDDRVIEEENAAITELAGDLDLKYLNRLDISSHHSLSDYLASQKEARADWSAQVSYASSPERLLRMNERRKQLGDHWQALISRVGTVYTGPVSYAANYDSYQQVDFWDKLDFIGINAYFPLRETLETSRFSPGFEMGLENKWQEILKDINSFRKKNDIADKRVIFTELGYTYRRHSTVQPWGYSGFILVGMENERDLLVWEEEPPDFEERALAIRALHRAYKKNSYDYLAGMLYWKFSTDKRHLEIEPFLVHLDPDIQDPVLEELRRFLN